MDFLNYSLSQQKSIKAVMLINAQMVQKNIKVTKIENDGFYFTMTTSKKEHYCSNQNLLASHFVRGDAEGK